MKISLNEKVKIDLDKLIESRMLIQANSGGGKSWANRRFIEQTFGEKQIIVIDPEGEFGNMRGELDFLYIGKDGDAPAEIRSAALLARRLMETKANAIVDIYEMNMRERQRFVAVFLEAMVNLPKELWHDCFIILDEAHKFAPEKEQSESLEAVSDMASRGRKRGYCLIPATQRPAKLNKDVAAECNNKLIGRASLDIDRKRSAEELGFTTKEEILSLRHLEPGEFYAFGPAISKEIVKLKIGDVKIKPATRGQGKKTLPAPTAKVKKLLEEFKDLPQEAVKEAQTVSSLQAEIKTLKTEVVQLRKVKEPVGGASKEDIEKAVRAAVVKANQASGLQWEKVVNKWKKYAEDLLWMINHLGQSSAQAKAPELIPPGWMTPSNLEEIKIPKEFKPTRLPKVKDVPGFASVAAAQATAMEMQLDGVLTGPEKRIVNAIAWLESIGVNDPEQTAVAFLAGYTYGGGGFNNPRGALKTKGLVEYRPGNCITLTETGRAIAEQPDVPLTNDALHQKVLSILPGPERRLLEPLLAEHPNALSNEELAERSNYKVNTGGYNNPRGRLKTLGLVEYPQPGFVKARDILFVE